MKEYDIGQLLKNQEKVGELIHTLLLKKLIQRQTPDKGEIAGHLLKANHNLRFVAQTKIEFNDWTIIGCYYACYHAALALIMTKGYSSKNHLATLCLLIQNFYKKELNEEDLKIFSQFLDYEDILFYVESKNKREDAAYSTKTLFQNKDVGQLKIKATLFVNKINVIIQP